MIDDDQDIVQYAGGMDTVIKGNRFMGGGWPSLNIPQWAWSIAQNLRIHFPGKDHATQQALCVAEEAGEFVGAYRRWAGMARRNGSWDDVKAELADVVITAYVTASILDFALDEEIGKKLEIIFSRGWKEES